MKNVKNEEKTIKNIRSIKQIIFLIYYLFLLFAVPDPASLFLEILSLNNSNETRKKKQRKTKINLRKTKNIGDAAKQQQGRFFLVFVFPYVSLFFFVYPYCSVFSSYIFIIFLYCFIIFICFSSFFSSQTAAGQVQHMGPRQHGMGICCSGQVTWAAVSWRCVDIFFARKI